MSDKAWTIYLPKAHKKCSHCCHFPSINIIIITSCFTLCVCRDGAQRAGGDRELGGLHQPGPRVLRGRAGHRGEQLYCTVLYCTVLYRWGTARASWCTASPPPPPATWATAWARASPAPPASPAPTATRPATVSEYPAFKAATEVRDISTAFSLLRMYNLRALTVLRSPVNSSIYHHCLSTIISAIILSTYLIIFASMWHCENVTINDRWQPLSKCWPYGHSWQWWRSQLNSIFLYDV